MRESSAELLMHIARTECPPPAGRRAQNVKARDRQIGVGAGWFPARGLIEWGTLLLPHENGRSAC
jgi:hypothetical protein